MGNVSVGLFALEYFYYSKLPVWSKNSTPAGEIQGNEPAQFPETDLKQVLWGTRSWRERPKSLI